MMRSLYSGVAGLKTHQTRMDVIGNNIANVNTTAYKSSSMTFSELMSQTTQKASGANATTGVGGTNAKQIGLGVKAGAINTAITTQGSAQSTGNPFDIMITGDNFFVVSNGSENFFTRDGSFYVDGAGNLAMTSTGYNVMGWGVDETTGNIKQDTVTALRIMSSANMTYPPEATTKANISGILDQNDKDVTSANGKTVNLNFFDARGYSYTAKFTFKQSGGDKTNEYSLELNKILDSTGKEIDISGIVDNIFLRLAKDRNKISFFSLELELAKTKEILRNELACVQKKVENGIEQIDTHLFNENIELLELIIYVSTTYRIGRSLEDSQLIKLLELAEHKNDYSLDLSEEVINNIKQRNCLNQEDLERIFLLRKGEA